MWLKRSHTNTYSDFIYFLLGKEHLNIQKNQEFIKWSKKRRFSGSVSLKIAVAIDIGDIKTEYIVGRNFK
ncbi:hypothetical protein NSA27_04110 [Clostridium tepidum]|uniref:hypothetical protein n=1 Tax=Clostridium tepidum TaxID=1962263 RepID=UPI00214A1447|nr:hypothetical protein [Clostridium tepidum]MCR1933886.1 hypothetical protein [Clostridium tepidum]